MLDKKDIKKVFDEVGLNIDVDQVDASVPLNSVGVDSLDFFNVLVELEKLTGTTVPDEDVDKLSSIDDIIAYFS